jgi:hypothetical protein
LGDWFLLKTYFLTSKASPNDLMIVIVIIIVIGEVRLVLHIGGIIAQTLYLDRGFLPRKNSQQGADVRLMAAKTISPSMNPIANRLVITIPI